MTLSRSADAGPTGCGDDTTRNRRAADARYPTTEEIRT